MASLSSRSGRLPICTGMNDVRAHPRAQPARRGLAVVLLALLAPPGTLLLLRTVPALDLVLRSALAHLVVVSAISACALAVAVAAAAAAGRSRDGSLVLLALGCLGVGFLMLGHGLMTPGIAGRPGNLWVGRLPVLAIAAFAVCLAAAAWPQRPPAAWAGRWPRATLTAGGAALALMLTTVSLWPTAGVGGRPLPGEAGIRLALVLAAALVLVAVGAVHWRRWRLGLDSMQLALVVACLLSAGALGSLQLGRLWHLAWWDYHAFLLAGFAAAISAVLTGYRRSRTLHQVLDGVFTSDPMAHISRGYSETLRALIGAVEARDAYTHGHSARVAELSVSIGLRLGLRPAALRTLAEGAYLHDVGKVGIPDHILNKPGSLTDEERAWIQEHPLVGSDIVGRAPSLRDALAVIRQHHERYDGQGYPDGLAGEEISLFARIVAVADVWDALTSDRAYRPAWPPDRALRNLEAGRGTHFDPRCLDAFLAVMAERGHRPGHGDGDAAVADAAAEACHDQPQTAEFAATPPSSGQR
jgi:HD-GYP domain-containing protein (c-di-GMP phosphodiesterase class II)